MLQWSFLRDDLPRSEVCRQIGLALRDEAMDLEKAGIRIIQIDEPAIRECLPLRKAEWKAFLDWAVESLVSPRPALPTRRRFTLTYATRSSTTSWMR